MSQLPKLRGCFLNEFYQGRITILRKLWTLLEVIKQFTNIDFRNSNICDSMNGKTCYNKGLGALSSDTLSKLQAFTPEKKMLRRTGPNFVIQKSNWFLSFLAIIQLNCGLLLRAPWGVHDNAFYASRRIDGLLSDKLRRQFLLVFDNVLLRRNVPQVVARGMSRVAPPPPGF